MIRTVKRYIALDNLILVIFVMLLSANFVDSFTAFDFGYSRFIKIIWRLPQYIAVLLAIYKMFIFIKHDRCYAVLSLSLVLILLINRFYFGITQKFEVVLFLILFYGMSIEIVLKTYLVTMTSLLTSTFMFCAIGELPVILSEGHFNRYRMTFGVFNPNSMGHLLLCCSLAYVYISRKNKNRFIPIAIITIVNAILEYFTECLTATMLVLILISALLFKDIIYERCSLYVKTIINKGLLFLSAIIIIFPCLMANIINRIPNIENVGILYNLFSRFRLLAKAFEICSLSLFGQQLPGWSWGKMAVELGTQYTLDNFWMVSLMSYGLLYFLILFIMYHSIMRKYAINGNFVLVVCLLIFTIAGCMENFYNHLSFGLFFYTINAVDIDGMVDCEKL